MGEVDLKQQTFRVHDKVLRLTPSGIEAAERFKASTGYEVDFDGILDRLRRAPPGELPAGFGVAFEEVVGELNNDGSFVIGGLGGHVDAVLREAERRGKAPAYPDSFANTGDAVVMWLLAKLLRLALARAHGTVKDPSCSCPATSEYDPPCPRHGVLGIGVTGR